MNNHCLSSDLPLDTSVLINDFTFFIAESVLGSLPTEHTPRTFSPSALVFPQGQFRTQFTLRARSPLHSISPLYPQRLRPPPSLAPPPPQDSLAPISLLVSLTSPDCHDRSEPVPLPSCFIRSDSTLIGPDSIHLLPGGTPRTMPPIRIHLTPGKSGL